MYSEAGQGSVFAIYLPRVEAGIHMMGTANGSEATGCATGTVLVVEDEDDVRSVICDFLGSRGIRSWKRAWVTRPSRWRGAMRGPLICF